jgi:hypothetical protein
VPPNLKPLVVLFAVIATFVVLSLRPDCAFAHDVPTLPANVTSAVVRVDAYEHSSLGAVIGDGRLVLVPFETIEVARPGFPHAIVTDANGTRHDAGVAATDRASGLALLAVEHPLTATPFAMSPSTLADVIDTFGIVYAQSSGPLTDAAWTFYVAGALAGRGRVQAACAHVVSPWPPGSGSPIVDVEGRLVALMGDGIFLSPQPIELSAGVLARLDGSQRGRRPLIFYGGAIFPISFTPNGGVWFGLGVGFAARIHDVVELRLDAEFSALIPTRNPPESCGGNCYAGIRGVGTPAIGYRWVVGGFGGLRAWPIALTPSLGVAFGVQDTSREHGASLRDATTPSTWAELATGLALAMSFGEIRGRVRVPVDDGRSPTIELGVGFTF